ncbi:MAG: hypothetical protein GY765_13785 [bacterium]|nr:hypothetical protein [bacterium]
MGKMINKIHGRSGFLEACSHVAEEIDNNRYGQFHQAGTLLVCEACLRKYHLERLEGIEPANKGISSFWENEELLEEYFEAYDQVPDSDRNIRCSECVAVAKVEQARRNGEDDPFPTYEKTLNSHNSEIIQELKNLLMVNFQFRNSIVIDNESSLRIAAGGYRYPLTVTIYYVTNEDDQNRIVNTIDVFFHDKELNQAKILFYEAEVWETHSNHEDGRIGGRRGEEKLAREVILNCQGSNNHIAG